MSIRSNRLALQATGLLLLSLSSAHSQVECWAPGMNAPILLTETYRSTTVSLGKPFRYDVFGVAGKIELGNKANNAVLSGNVFKEKILGGLLGTGSTVSSTAYVYLQTGLTNIYPQNLSVSSTGPGASIGPIYKYDQNWTLSDPVAPKNVNLGFHMAGSSLLGALLPGLVSPAYYNLNPKGHFYVLGEYHAAPPVMTGTLGVSSSEVIAGSSVNVSFGVNRNQLPIYRPPFLGLDLADVGLTVLGSPPQRTANGPIAGALDEISTGLGIGIQVTVNLAANSGPGWIKVSNSSTP